VSALSIVVATLAAGAAGAVLRFAMTARSARIGTALANVTGTSLLALVLVAHGSGTIDTGPAVVLGVGLSGSLTTFSGWMAVLSEGLRVRPRATLLLDLLLPLVAAVAVTVAAFVLLA